MHNTLLQFLQKRNIAVRIKENSSSNADRQMRKCIYTNIYGIQYILKVNGRRLHVSNL